MALVMSRGGEEPTNTLVLGAWPFHALNVAAIYRLRRLRPKMRGLPRLSASPYALVLAVIPVSYIFYLAS